MGVSASTSLNEAVSPQLPLMCTEKPRSCQVHWIVGGERGQGVKKQTGWASEVQLQRVTAVLMETMSV